MARKWKRPPHLRWPLAVEVGVTGFEPATSSSRTKRSTKLSYTPSPNVILCDAIIAPNRNHSGDRKKWAEQDSNLRRRTPTGLQPVPFGHLGIRPNIEPRTVSAAGRLIKSPIRLVLDRISDAPPPSRWLFLRRDPWIAQHRSSGSRPWNPLLKKPPGGLEPPTSRLQVRCSSS